MNSKEIKEKYNIDEDWFTIPHGITFGLVRDLFEALQEAEERVDDLDKTAKLYYDAGVKLKSESLTELLKLFRKKYDQRHTLKLYQTDAYQIINSVDIKITFECRTTEELIKHLKE